MKGNFAGYEGGPSVKKFPLILIFAIFLGWVSLAHATTTYPSQGIDACVASGGAESVIISGTFTKVTTQGVYSDNGKMAVECQVTGTVLKGNNQIQASDNPNAVFAFKIIHPSLVPGLQICQQGATGVWLIYGAGSWGLQSFVNNGNCDIPLTQGADGKFYAARKHFQFKNSQFKQKFLAGNTTANKLLSGAPAEGPGLSQADVNNMVRGMAADIWGGRGTTGPGADTASQGGTGKGAEGVNIIFGK
jgi:hypothetical protein